jgi:3-oxoacyl-[acyl-carrier protein] reductase
LRPPTGPPYNGGAARPAALPPVNPTSPIVRRALVTGGSRGIGAAVCKRLAKAGHPVIVNYRRDAAAAAAVVDEITRAGGEAVAVAFDVADGASTAAALKELLKDPRPIGIVVNNAGVTADAAFPGMKKEQWDGVLQTTLGGFFHVTQPLVMPMVMQRWGRIVNMASLSAVRGNRGQANYAAAKAGLVGATKTLALEVAKKGVTVNALAPGLIATEMIAGVPDQMVQQIPMQRLGTADEVAALVAFLCSEDAGYITGQCIGIDGGFGV